MATLSEEESFVNGHHKRDSNHIEKFIMFSHSLLYFIFINYSKSTIKVHFSFNHIIITNYIVKIIVGECIHIFLEFTFVQYYSLSYRLLPMFTDIQITFNLSPVQHWLW